MALMSRKVDYALLILAHLDRCPEGCCARMLADRLKLSRAFAANILKELCQKGFVSSQRGVKGGYVLQRSMEQTSFCELLEALDQPVWLAECSRGDASCPLAEVCSVRVPIAEVHRRICEVLRGVKLAELMRPHSTAEV